MNLTEDDCNFLTNQISTRRPIRFRQGDISDQSDLDKEISDQSDLDQASPTDYDFDCSFVDQEA